MGKKNLYFFFKHNLIFREFILFHIGGENIMKRQTSEYIIDHTKMGIDDRYRNVKPLFGTQW